MISTVMAIQFYCASCRQPIEIDDEWAEKNVVCPYCRHTVSAPAISQIGEAPPPQASGTDRDTDMPRPETSGLEAPQHLMTAPSPPHYGEYPPQTAVPKPAPQGNAIGWVGLCLTISALMLTFAMFGIAGANSDEFAQFATAQSAEQERPMAEFEESFPGWFVAMSLTIMAIVPLWLAGLICSIIGVTSPHKQGPAVIGVILASLLPIFFCVGLSIIAAIAREPAEQNGSAPIKESACIDHWDDQRAAYNPFLVSKHDTV